MPDSCETTCETPQETAGPCDLWRLFPLIIRYKDAVASGDLQDASVMGNLEKIVYALESECGITRQEVENLANLIDADSCDAEFLLYLSATLGELVGEQSRGDDFRRWLIKNLVSFHKIKGTHPSWGLQFQWLTNFWRDGWELWKTIAYEEGDYSRVRTYRHLIRAARFDLYSRDGLGVAHYLTPTEAQQYTPYVERLRPIHVLLRHWNERVVISDSLGTFNEIFEIHETITFDEEAGGFSDSLTVMACLYGCEISCEDTCQGSCEDICELTCEGGTCEVACQAGIQTPVVINVADVTCKFSCESGACEYGCQIGSCQSGCETCGREVEIFPVRIAAVDAPSPGDPASHPGTLRGHVWFPERPELVTDEPEFPPKPVPPSHDSITNPWWMHNPALGGAAVEVFFRRHGGKGHVDGNIVDATVIPGFRIGDWTTVRCQLGRENTEEHAVRGNGIRKRWRSVLGGRDPFVIFRPHICTVQTEAVLGDLDEEVTGTILEGSRLAQMPDTSLFNTGDYIVISDDNDHESNVVAGTSAILVYFENETQHAYTDNPRIARKGLRQVATASDLQTPILGHWYGLFTGDVDGTVVESLRRMDYRTREVVITFKDPPPPGAVITSHYVPENTCIYYLTSQPQGIREDNLALDALARLGFMPGTLAGQIWYWDGSRWRLLTPPPHDGNIYGLTILNGVLSWLLVSPGVCPPPPP